MNSNTKRSWKMAKPDAKKLCQIAEWELSDKISSGRFSTARYITSSVVSREDGELLIEVKDIPRIKRDKNNPITPGGGLLLTLKQYGEGSDVYKLTLWGGDQNDDMISSNDIIISDGDVGVLKSMEDEQSCIFIDLKKNEPLVIVDHEGKVLHFGDSKDGTRDELPTAGELYALTTIPKKALTEGRVVSEIRAPDIEITHEKTPIKSKRRKYLKPIAEVEITEFDPKTIVGKDQTAGILGIKPVSIQSFLRRYPYVRSNGNITLGGITKYVIETTGKRFNKQKRIEALRKCGIPIENDDILKAVSYVNENSDMELLLGINYDGSVKEDSIEPETKEDFAKEGAVEDPTTENQQEDMEYDASNLDIGVTYDELNSAIFTREEAAEIIGTTHGNISFMLSKEKIEKEKRYGGGVIGKSIADYAMKSQINKEKALNIINAVYKSNFKSVEEAKEKIGVFQQQGEHGEEQTHTDTSDKKPDDTGHRLHDYENDMLEYLNEKVDIKELYENSGLTNSVILNFEKEIQSLDIDHVNLKRGEIGRILKTSELDIGDKIKIAKSVYGDRFSVGWEQITTENGLYTFLNGKDAHLKKK